MTDAMKFPIVQILILAKGREVNTFNENFYLRVN